MSSSDLIVLGGITFHKGNVLKMKKADFMNAYKSEELWDQIQKLKPKPKPKKKKSD